VKGLCLIAASAALGVLAPGIAIAQQLSPETPIDISPTPPEPRAATGAGAPSAPDATAEAPPPRPRHKGFVLTTDLGVLGFAGQFRHVAPPAYWLAAQLGFELLDWLMVFGEGELAFTDTSESQDESHSVAVPMWGFGGGARGTLHASERVGVYAQAEVGLLTSLVAHGALAILGYRNAESLNPQFGGRLGVEWYQLDRHMAMTASFGGRLAEGFSRTGVTQADTPLMWDASLGLRYTF
jgi:hypothetical protein